MAVRAILGAVPSGHWMRWYCSMDRVVMGSRWTRWTTWGSRSGVSRVKKPLDDHVQSGRVARGKQHMGGFFRKGKELLKLLP